MDDSDRLSALRQELRRSLGSERYELWLGPQTTLTLADGVLLVGCASQIEVQWLRRNLHEALASCSATIFGSSPSVEFAATAQPAQSSPAAGSVSSTVKRAPRHTPRKQYCQSQLTLGGIVEGPALPQPATQPLAAAPEQLAERKRPRWTFEDFVVGDSNRMAAEAARSATQQLGRLARC